MENLTKLEKSIIFATKAHAGTKRKGKNFPYIIHPLEALSIVATMTDDEDMLTAAVLHDVVEDTSFTLKDIEREFGKEVANYVDIESDKKEHKNADIPWRDRKAETMMRIKDSSVNAKIISLGDKLSNMRAIKRDYDVIKDDIWNIFKIKNPVEHAWHYYTLVDSLSDLKEFGAYKEFKKLVDEVFGKYKDKI